MAVKLPQYGGEGIANYKGNKSNSSLTQLGGEGGGKDGNVPKGGNMSLLKPKEQKGYCGEGRYLSSN